MRIEREKEQETETEKDKEFGLFLPLIQFYPKSAFFITQCVAINGIKLKRQFYNA